MGNVVVVGAQWGDEGKGKIVDWLSEQADTVVRFQGGHNAGHTLVIDGAVYKLSLLPSGVVREGKLGVIGNGVVLDPHALVAEIDRLQGQGVKITRANLRVADNAALILSVHRELDALRESGASSAIGTTGTGVSFKMRSMPALKVFSSPVLVILPLGSITMRSRMNSAMWSSRSRYLLVDSMTIGQSEMLPSVFNTMSTNMDMNTSRHSTNLSFNLRSILN
jgi:hypothetical protein